jgi:hypothetical protein
VLRVLGLSLLLVAVGVLGACAQPPAATRTPTRQAVRSPTSAASPVGVPSPTVPPPASPTASGEPTPAESPGATPSPPTTPDEAAPPDNTTPPDANAIAEEARAAVAQQLGISPAQVTVASVQEVEWSDTSLGCPEPGMDYAQEVTPGYLIRLSASGQSFEYHADREGEVITCSNPQPPALVGP